MPERRWKRVANELHGRGNGYHATVYLYWAGESEGSPSKYMATVRKGDSYIGSKIHPSEAAAKALGRELHQGVQVTNINLQHWITTEHTGWYADTLFKLKAEYDAAAASIRMLEAVEIVPTPGRDYHDIRTYRDVTRLLKEKADDVLAQIGAILALAFVHDHTVKIEEEPLDTDEQVAP